jgi:hypothetical protein
MKATLLVTTIIIMISTTTTVTILLQQYHQTAQAYPCVGGSAKQYCTAYHDGPNQAHTDYKTGHDLDIYQHRCTNNSNDYCNGYARGYSDEADFLG